METARENTRNSRELCCRSCSQTLEPAIKTCWTPRRTNRNDWASKMDSWANIQNAAGRLQKERCRCNEGRSS